VPSHVYDYVAPGLLAHRTRAPDMTALIDDQACTRVRTCTLCGHVAQDMELRCWTGAGEGLAIGVLLCPVCRRVDGEVLTEAVDIMLKRRYDPARFGPHENGDAHGPDDRQ
jgi:hypothetical protein